MEQIFIMLINQYDISKFIEVTWNVPFFKKMHWSKKEFHLKAQCVTFKAIYRQ